MPSDLRPEREHLLMRRLLLMVCRERRAEGIQALLTTTMDEGVLYEYTMAGDSDGSRLTNSNATLVIAGVSLVRHQYELSCVLVAGENPANPPDDSIGLVDSTPAAKAKEKVVPHPDFEVG